MVAKTFDLKTNVRELVSVLERADKSVAAGIRAAINELGVQFDRDFASKQFHPYEGRSRESGMQVRSGALRNSRKLVRAKPQGNLGSIRMRVELGSAFAPYARIHEFGGTITPKKGRFLTVPLKSALTPSGVLRGKNKLVRRGTEWQTASGDPTFIARGRSGALLVFADRERFTAKGNIGGKLEPLYVLKRSVKIKPRLGFFSTWKDLEQTRFPRLLRRRILREMKELERRGRQ